MSAYTENNHGWRIKAYHTNGAIKSYSSDFEESWIIDGIMYSAPENSDIEMYDNEQIKSIILSGDVLYDLDGYLILLKKGVKIFFKENGELMYRPHKKGNYLPFGKYFLRSTFRKLLFLD